MTGSLIGDIILFIIIVLCAIFLPLLFSALLSLFMPEKVATAIASLFTISFYILGAYLIVFQGAQWRTRLLKTPIFSQQDTGYVALSGYFESDTLYQVNEQIQVVFAELKLLGYYEEEDNDEAEEVLVEIIMKNLLKAEPPNKVIVSHQWFPHKLYFLSNRKKFTIDSLALLTRIPRYEMNITQNALYQLEDGRYLVYFQLGNKVFQYAFSPDSNYIYYKVKLYFVPTQIPYTLFTHIQKEHIQLSNTVNFDYPNGNFFYAEKGTPDIAFQTIRKERNEIYWIASFLLLGALISAGVGYCLWTGKC